MRTTAMFAALMLGGCAHMVPKESVIARATISTADGVGRGLAMISDTSATVRLTITVSGFQPGAHGLHIHTVGRCDAPDFQTAGAHWNPAMKQHGRDNPMGAHSGDLPNLDIGSDGRGTLSVELPAGSEALLDSDGAAIVIHAAPDNYKTDPSGNSGGRIACGVFNDG
jgi:superoxide dismutase, Cu-Zn family